MVDGELGAMNNVQLKAYLYGVVPSEMPYTWVPEALKVQAVAARSYALAVRKLNSWFDLYPDTRSQVSGRDRGREGFGHGCGSGDRRRGRPL